MRYTIIVAVSDNGVIGKNNQLLWHLNGDMKRFKALTTGHTVVMGRNTFLSIGKALPNRRNVVLSSTMKKENFENVEVFPTIEAFQDSIFDEEEVYVIGGGKVYRSFLPLTDKVCMTRVHTVVEGDTTFPELDSAEWKTIATEKMTADEKNDFDYDFVDYIRG